MNLVKDIITGPQCLARFDPKKPILLITDASRIGLGFVLIQPEADDPAFDKNGYLITTSPTSYTIKKHPKGRLVMCGSRFISATELDYAVVELEMLALVWAVQKCRLYLAGGKVRNCDGPPTIDWNMQWQELRRNEQYEDTEVTCQDTWL